MNSNPMHLFCGLGASVCAFSLSIGQTPALASNPDRTARQLNNFNARAEWRADRALRHQQRHPILTPGFRVPAPGEIIRPVNPVEPPSFERHVRPDGIKTNRHDSHTTGDTILFPGQVSSFRTTRPEVSNRSTYTNDGGKNRTLHNGVSLDLSSTDANITVGSNLLGDSQVTISVGGATKDVSAGTKVTAAEYAALNQKLATGSQALKLNGQGAATDGSLNINLVADDGKTIRTSEFVIPEGVEVVGDFGRHADGVRVTHDLVNYGSIYAVSSNRDRDTAVIAARDINNELGGLITTDVPRSVSSQFGSTNSNLNLAVRADRDLNNAGEITSSGELELSAGRSINNVGASSLAQARGNVSLNAPQINNQGLVHSTRESVNISAPTDSHLLVDNTGGEIRALMGNIELATNAGADVKTNTTLTGGDWHANELNIVSGCGDVAGNVGDVTAIVNITGGSAQFHASGETLLMGAMNVTGDPLISGANVIISANQVTGGQPLSIIASGSVTVLAGVTTIDTSLAAGTGGNILIVAGAAFTTPSDLEITGGTVAGGNVNLTGITTFRSGGAGTSTVNGGNIGILAFGGAGTGTVTVPAATGIFTGGSAAGTRGNLTIIAGATNVAAVSIGVPNSVGGTGAGGNITIAAAAPTVVTKVVIETTAGATQGQVNSGSFGIGAATGGSISTSTITTDGSDVSITGGGNVTTSAITTSGLSSAVGGGDVTVTTGATGALTTGVINANAFNSGGGNGGNVTVFAGAWSPSVINARASQTATGTGNGGIVFIDVSTPAAFNSVGINARGGLLSGNGGSITVENRSSFGITIDSVLDFQVDAAGTGNGGHIVINATTGATDGVVTFNVAPLTLAADAGTAGGGTGGTINILGSSLVFAGVAGGAHTLSAVNGDNTGGISIITTTAGVTSSGRPLTINTTGNVVMALQNNTYNSSIATGAGGALTISAGTAINNPLLNINTSSIGANGAGGAVVLNTTTGTIAVGNITSTGDGTGAGGLVAVGSATVTQLSVGNINTRGGTNGSGGTVTLLETGASGLLVGQVRTDAGAAAGNAGPISITNSGNGGIILTGPLYSATSLVGAGGDIAIVASGTGLIGVNLDANVSANGATTNGNITLTGASIITTGNDLTIFNDGNGGAGDITINATAAAGGLTTTGGAINFDASRDIFLNLGTAGVNTTPAAGNGGAVILAASAGSLDATGEIITTSGAGGGNDAGIVSLSSANAGFIDVGNITANGGGGVGEAGGNVSISSGTGGLTVGNIASNAFGGVGGIIQITANQAATLTLGLVQSNALINGDVSITNAGVGDIATTDQVVGANVIFDATAGGDITLGNSALDTVTGTTSIEIRAAGTITQAASAQILGAPGAPLTVEFGTGPVTLSTTVSSISSDAPGQTLTINQPSQQIQLGTQSISQLTVNAATGNITTTANISGFNALTLNAGGGSGIILNNAITANANGTVSLTTNNGTITQSAAGIITTSGAAGGLTVNLAGGTPGNANLNVASNSINRLTGIGGATIFLDNGNTGLTVLGLGAAQSLVLTTTNAATGIAFGAAINTTGTLTLNTPRFASNLSTTAASILIQNLSGDLNIVGSVAPGASLNGTTPAAGPPGSPSTPAAIIFNTASGAQLNLFGNIDFTGDVEMNNQFGTTTAANLAQFDGANNVTLNTGNFVMLGTPPQITGFNFDLNLSPQGTVINPDGPVNFSINTTINGSDFAIIARTFINLGTITINLSNAAGDGGNLTLLSGFDSTPTGGGQQQTIAPFTIIGPSGLGGNINAGGVTINTSATGGTGNGGNVLAAAHQGSITLGTLGAINTSSANGVGGSVTLIGQAITVGAINTTGLTTAGDVTLSVSTPVVTGIPVVTNGTISGGSFSPGSIITGTITATTINAGRSGITFEAAGDITLNGALTFGSLNLLAGGNNVNSNFINTLTAQTDLLGNGGSINIQALNVLTGALPLTLNAIGTGAGNGGQLSYINGGIVTLGTDVILNAQGPGSGGSVTVRTANNLTINVGGINLAGSAGDGAQLILEAGTVGTGLLSIVDLSVLTHANATSPNGNGGRIDLLAPTMNFLNSSAAPLTLLANGQGTGDGGTITYSNLAITSTFIGTPTKAPKPPATFLSLGAVPGAGGDGGSISVTTGGALTANTDFMVAGPSGAGVHNGASYSLIAGSNLIVTGTTTGDLFGAGVNGGTGGVITLQSKSKTAFAMDTTKPPKNGMLGIASGAEVHVTNLGGGIKVNTNAAIVAASQEFVTGLKGGVATGVGVVLNAASDLTMTADTGSIGKKELLVATAVLQVNTTGGSVKIKNQFIGATTLNDSSAGKKFTLTTTDSLTLNDIETTAGAILVVGGTGGTLQVAPNSTITANDGTLTLRNDDINFGDIAIGDGATVATDGPKGGATTISIGPAPKTGTNTTEPVFVGPTNAQGKGQAFFEGPVGSIIGLGPINTNINALFKNVMISNGSLTPLTNLITLGSAATITADPPMKTPSLSPAAIINTSSLINVPVPQTNLGETIQATAQQPATLDVLQSGLNNASLSALVSGIDTGIAGTTNLVGLNRSLDAKLVSTNPQGLVTIDETRSMCFGQLNLNFDSSLSDPNVEQVSGSDLIVNAAFHSDKGTSLSQFAIDKVSDLNMSERSDASAKQLPNSKQYVLKQGNVVCAPNCDTTIETSHGTVKLRAHSVALVMQSQEGLAVYDLDDHSKNSVVVEAKGKRVSLSPGQHVLFSSHGSEQFEDVNPIELIQYRGLNKSKLSNGWKVYTSEFSIPSACYAVQPLRHLTASKHSADAKMRAHMMKTTAVIMTLNPDRGDYTQFFKTRMTAMK